MNNYFDILYKLAEKAAKKGEVPVAALIVKDNKIIAKAHNTRKSDHNPLNHAEIKCIIKAAKKNKDWRLNEYELYVTLKPCNMCQSIINECRINKVNYLISNQKNAQYETIYNQADYNLSKKYQKLLSSFFKTLR